MRKNYHFWLVYAAAWTAYGISLGAVFVGVGYRFDINLLIRILCNVIPAALLGILVVRICRKLKWSVRGKSRFVLIHILSLILYTVLWCFLTLFNLSIVSFFQQGTWIFIVWDIFALQWQLFSGAMAYATIASAVHVKQINENLQIEERRNAELLLRAARAETARTSTELMALRAQLNPHFLFNTLHSLMALVRTDANAAEEAIERFAVMLRYVLQSQDKSRLSATDVTFGEEWNFVQNYLELERLRLGERLKLTTDINNAVFSYCLPAFSLQPIVENAVKHAIAPSKGGGELYIAAYIADGNLIIKVEDNGDKTQSTNEQNQNGLGLRLVRESLTARFGAAASLITKSIPNQGFRVMITIPQTNSFGENFNLSENGR